MSDFINECKKCTIITFTRNAGEKQKIKTSIVKRKIKLTSTFE